MTQIYEWKPATRRPVTVALMRSDVEAFAALVDTFPDSRLVSVWVPTWGTQSVRQQPVKLGAAGRACLDSVLGVRR